MINRQVLTVSATISAKVAGDVGRFYPGCRSVKICNIIYMILLQRVHQGCF
ncbi:hypothetical protein [Nostoc sp.]|uniref:hypothetical protein n=1 Tax=Nostoc sp. TaxID=1180 RepID=UPI002FF646B5